MPALYVVRHGEPALRGVMLGRTDPPLSAAGGEQMRAISLPVRTVFTSPLRRALESAELLARGAEIIVLDDLSEIALGAWDGKAWEEIEVMDPELSRKKLKNWTAVTPPDGEPWSDFECRVHSAVDIVRKRGEDAALVGHVAVNACIASLLVGLDPLRFRQDYGQVYEYRFQ
jgi:broad specificity phosphatase PhoE